MSRVSRVFRLVGMDASLLLRSARILAFTLLALIPTVIVMYVAGLFWIPQSWQNMRLVRLMWEADPYLRLRSEYLDTLREMHGMITGFWAGFPMMVVASLVASGFIAGERASGTFDLLATKPVRRYELALSKMTVFLLYAALVLLVVQVLNVLVVASSFFSGLGAGYVVRALLDSGSIVLYYTAASWLYVLAVTSLTILLSTRTTREFVAVMGVIGYQVALGLSAGMVETLVSGQVGRTVAGILRDADFSRHVEVVLVKWLYGSLQPLSGSSMLPSYLVSLAVLLAVPLLLTAASMYILEHMDLT